MDRRVEIVENASEIVRDASQDRPKLNLVLRAVRDSVTAV
eukprot:SAG31_NODE_756_length_12303_cov_8.918142_5_plen_40_part_00